MRDPSVPRSAASARDLLELARAHGVEDEVALRGTSLTAAHFADPIAEIPGVAELRMIANVQAALPAVHDLGLQAGGRCRPDAVGMPGLLLLCSGSAGDALAAAARYQDLCYGIPRARVRRGSSVTTIEFALDGFPTELHAYLVDHACATLHAFSAPLGVKTPARRVELSQPRPRHAHRYERLFGTPAEFSRPVDRVTYDNSVLAQPMPQANTVVVPQLHGHCADLLKRRHAHVGAAGRVRAVLEQATGPPPPLPKVAEELRMSPRTVRRALTAEGTSFRALDAEVRMVRAMRDLDSPGMSIDATARQLGYATTSAFVQAFKRWTGHTPGGYRRRTRP
ncbi:AraC family transcriptional regulator [Actinomadura darangshiensis]|uniref:AraC family transcriptional regulator n=1 Tax=Actinomadura darangshiensis TaxID=705336 RepID=A0A4R5B9M4_9ACTN|nr:AraC family transcriptional regulator [Actinomadura darangshiensis]TDD81350.1 AraC family transcriptional regulator [Actinomadura darangshiensis]